jgi:hypothetical protein
VALTCAQELAAIFCTFGLQLMTSDLDDNAGALFQLAWPQCLSWHGSCSAVTSSWPHRGNEVFCQIIPIQMHVCVATMANSDQAIKRR